MGDLDSNDYIHFRDYLEDKVKIDRLKYEAEEKIWFGFSESEVSLIKLNKRELINKIINKSKEDGIHKL